MFFAETAGRPLPETVEDAEAQDAEDPWLQKVNKLFGFRNKTNSVEDGGGVAA